MLDQTHTTKDAPKDQVIAFDDNCITMDRVPPFGHIGLTLAKGTLPEKYKGVYTSFDLANHAALQYIEQYWKAKAEISQEALEEEIRKTVYKIKQKKVDGTTKSDSDREQLH